MKRNARVRGRPVKRAVPPPDDEKFVPPDLALTIAIFLRHRRPVRRRPGSAVDFAELSKRITLKELKAQRERILKGPIQRIRRFASRQGMSVKAADVLGRCVYLRASAADVERV